VRGREEGELVEGVLDVGLGWVVSVCGERREEK
jgi:hypothetical protein